MTSPQQPQPQAQPERGPNDQAAAQGRTPPAPPMPPAAPAQQPDPQQSAGEAGTMMLQAQQPQPAKEAGTMTLQAQVRSEGPAPQPLAAGGSLAKDPGTMTLQAQAPRQQPPVPPQSHPQQGHAPQGNPQGNPHGGPQGAPQGGGANWQGGQPGYVSPIPVRSTHIGHALASEWTKIRSVRSTIWTLSALVVLIVGIGLLTALALGSQRTVDPKLGFSFFGVLLGTLCVIPLGVLVISSEYGTGMIRTTMTACPGRARVLAAKAIVFFALAFVITTLATSVVAVLTAGMVNGPDPTGGEWLRGTVGAGLYVSVLGLLALAVGSLLRHSAGAISAMLGLVLLPMLLAVFMLGSDSLKSVSQALIEYSVPNSLATLYGSPFLGTDTGPQGWTPLWILAGVTAVVLGGAFAAQAQRDV
ncbi:ABC transporter permease subunit [Streptomyces pinistramenti]|uniref:ABC transporter permease subunit n=1 Tax=Streptomyces pinistramenti TaxID=2884812 RepID=UPI001D083A3C|nr:ABC transporter permease subunit [Streptomyces pinistramenti]MCB5910868.1 ABC transporter permease [Streptomyces pinistramenti]